MTTLWSGRFAGPPDADLLAFGASFAVDRRLFEDDVTGSLAWAEALANAGVLEPAEADALARELADLLRRGREDPSFLAGDDEDVHSFVERHLVARLGDVGRKLHTGRSRNEQVSLDLRLYLRRRIPLLQQRVAALAATLVGQARAAGEALMPAYTHLRRAQPVRAAHYFLAHVAALRRDHARLGSAAEAADALPLGSGAVAGTSYAVDVGALARRLGFSRVVANSLDAASDRDFVADFLYAAALTMVHLSRLAEDVILFSGEEFSFFELADETTTGSSLMPQKKNPDPLELVRGRTGRAIGHLTGWLATLKGLPSGYNRDLQEDKPAVFDAEDTLAASLEAVTAVVSRMRANREVMARAAGGLLVATDVADYLVARGVPFRRAHEIVGAVVRKAIAEDRPLSSLTLDEWRAFSDRFDADIAARLTAEASVAARRTPQSTGPDAVAAALEEAERWVAAHLERDPARASR
ncbi:MAG TPA: argininosuccinate lyase [Vicinamibacterales bacterium]|nr:argininosuccinate lyase [Vicinamibacterales bacterium]